MAEMIYCYRSERLVAMYEYAGFWRCSCCGRKLWSVAGFKLTA